MKKLFENVGENKFKLSEDSDSTDRMKTPTKLYIAVILSSENDISIRREHITVRAAAASLQELKRKLSWLGYYGKEVFYEATVLKGKQK